jgi:ubiquitin C-terminal hydrolase
MIVTLNRFAFASGVATKNLRNVTFGDALVFDGSDVRARLIGVVFHSGQSAQHGHYYAFCLTSSGEWGLFNDSMVQRASFGQIGATGATFPRETPYVLVFSLER